MADERIDITVNDKIDPSIDRKLRSISTSAEKGSLSVKKLKADLATLNESPMRKLAAASETTTVTLNKELNSQNTLTKAVAAGEAVDVRAASAKTRVSAAIETEIEQQKRLASVIDRTIARQEAANAVAASNALASAGGVSGGSRAVVNRQNEMMGLTAATKELETATIAAETATVSRFGRIKLAAAGAYDTLRDGAYTVGSNFRGFFGANGAATIEKEAAAVTKLGTHAKGSSTAVRELFVIAREAGRGDFTRMAGSATILASALGLLQTVLLPVAVVLGIAAGALKLFQVSIQGDADRQLQAYSQHLGLTSKEMRKLGNETVDAHGKLKEFNAIKLTFGDVFKGLMKTINDTFNLTPALTSLKTMVYDTLVWVVKGFFELAAEISGVMVSAYIGIANLWKKFPQLLGDLFYTAVNKAIGFIEGLVNASIHGINWLAQQSNSIIGTTFGTISDVQLKRVENKYAGTAKNVQGTFIEAYKVGRDNALKFDNDFLVRWKKNSIEAGKSRLDALGKAIQNNRNIPKPKKETDPKTKADYLNDTNKKLDDELSRMHMLKDAREEQQRLDQIEEEFAKRRQPLTQKEIDGFRAKIHAIQDYKYVQSELDRIYESSVSPQRDYNSTLSAAKELFDQGAISAQKYGEEVFGASRKLAEATDPLFQIKEAMTTAEAATGLYGRAVQQAAYYESIRQAYLAKNQPLSQTYVAGLNSEVDALMRRNEALLQQQFIQAQVGSIVNPLLEEQQMLQNKAAMYAEIDRMRANDQLSEANAARAKYALNAKFDEMRLAGASAFFGELAGLASSGNKKLAAIGKAAAIAQATIDGFVAVQKALASAPPPWNFALAAAVAVKTGAQVAGIVSTNVGSFDRGTDFMVQGTPGVDRNNINMNVSRGERVIVQTPAQQRQAGNGGASNVTVPVKVINLTDKRELLVHMASDEGERIILNVLHNNPAHVAAAASAGS